MSVVVDELLIASGVVALGFLFAVAFYGRSPRAWATGPDPQGLITSADRHRNEH